MNRFKILISALLLAFSVTTLSAVTPQQSDSLHTKVWSVYAQGGVSMAKGLEIESINAPKGTDISTLYGLGVSYQFKPWVRMSLNYEYSKYTREQRYTSIQSFTTPQLSPPNMVLEEMFGGQTYYKVWTGYHNIDLTGDFNILELWKNRQNKWFNLYLSTGVGITLANGNGYDLAMGYEHWVDPNNVVSNSDYPEPLQLANNHEFYSWVTADNSRHSYKAAYIPVNLAAEFDVSPRVALGAKLMYKYVFSDEPFAPDHLMAAVATVRFNFVGAKHGYRSDKKRLADLRDSYNNLMDDYRNAQRECAENAAAQADRIRRLEDDNKLLRENLAECEAREPVIVESKEEVRSVQFLINSAIISDIEETRLLDFIETMKEDESITIQLVGEASVDGKADYNQKLSEARLAKVISIFEENGISRNRITSAEAIGADAGIDNAIARRVTITVE